MAVKLTDEQLVTVKSMMEICEIFADHILHIMQNHGLDKVDGSVVKIEVNPAYSLITKELQFGRELSADSGFIKLTRGLEEKKYGATGKNSPEYECLFAEPEIAERIRNVLKNTKPVLPRDIWIGDDSNNPPLDCYGREVKFDDIQTCKVGGACNDGMAES